MDAPQFFIELAAILIAARLAGELATRFGAPSVIGELAAGIILGCPTIPVRPPAGGRDSGFGRADRDAGTRYKCL